MGRALIYALCCPDTGEVRYIGKANDPLKRFKGHMRETRLKSPLYSWIGKLRAAGKMPVMNVIASTIGEWQECERVLISQYRESGRLLNLADGGDQPMCPTHVRAQNGKNSSKLRVSTELKKRIFHSKQMIGIALKQGYVSEATKVKLRYCAMKRPDLFGLWASV